MNQNALKCMIKLIGVLKWSLRAKKIIIRKPPTKNKNKESLNNKYEEEIKLNLTEFNEKTENNKYITQKEKNYNESCRKYYTHNSYDSKKDFTGNYQKRDSFVKTNRYEKKDIYDNGIYCT